MWRVIRCPDQTETDADQADSSSENMFPVVIQQERIVFLKNPTVDLKRSLFNLV